MLRPQLLKVAKYVPGKSQTEVDRESVLLRAYGNKTEILIDRDRDARLHALCAKHRLAPPLLARFKNGLMYRYIIGQVCTPQDIINERVWRAVAKHLGEWHARLPIDSVAGVIHLPGSRSANSAKSQSAESCFDISCRSPVPNIWSVMQRWIDALPCGSPGQKSQKEMLQIELDRSFRDLDNQRGPGSRGFVLGHCDLVSANIVMLPKDTVNSTADEDIRVSFIDYEYATPCPAAFDIANHFAEWGGYDCDHKMLPTKSIRRRFLKDYLQSYKAHCDTPICDEILDVLFEEVDRYRGMPGFYGGLWALIQASISQIDFDYASLAEVRLGEYFAWRAEENGSRAKEGKSMPLRERRWAET